MTQTQIDCFFAAVRTGSLAAAARELFLSVQTLSAHIHNLEKEFSVKLLKRKVDGVELTDEGQRFMSFARAWSDIYESTRKSIEAMYYNQSLKFTIAFSEWIDPLGELFDAVEDFALAHESTDMKAIHCSNRELLEKLGREEIDVAIMCDTQIASGADLDMISFAEEKLAIYHPMQAEEFIAGGKTRSLPRIDAPYGAWSEEEAFELSRRMSGRMGLYDLQGIRTSHCYTMPNFYSVVACAETIPCFAVSDTRFGHLRTSPGLQSTPLKRKSSLCCLWNRKDENPLLPLFTEHMINYFSD